MKTAIVKQAFVILSVGLFISCNNGTKDKASADTASTADTPATKPGIATNHDTDKVQKATTAVNQQNYQYEPAVSVITGTITTESFYGPPGFGEHPKTDSKEEPYILVTDKPINVISAAKDTNENGPETKNNVSKIQLIVPDNINLATYKNKAVRLTGTFFGPETGHHHTDVLLNIQKLEAL